MKTSIAISSGKGGTGKTFVATNIAKALEETGMDVTYLDCDVEEPNGHLFLKPEKQSKSDVLILSPMDIDRAQCRACGKCVEVCKYNALALINNQVLFFKNLCHICGACTLVCPENAIIENDRKIGDMISAKSGSINLHYASLETGEGGMSPRLIRKVKEYSGNHITILDSPPGTACPVVETIKHADLCVLITDPTPFGINDLKLAVNMSREIGKEPVIIVNRAEYHNDDLKTYCRENELEVIGEIPDQREIAECYSEGNLLFAHLPRYQPLFYDIADRLLEKAGNPKKANRKINKQWISAINQKELNTCQLSQKTSVNQRVKELVVISGKGGTGKTSLVASFCALEKNIAISDCDVDAADLHLLLKPNLMEKGCFSGGEIAVIDPEKCRACGACLRACRFSAIEEITHNNSYVYHVNEHSCEGCGVCQLVCSFNAVSLHRAINGQWFISKTEYGPMSHAKLGTSEENSGKLVTHIRDKKNQLARIQEISQSIIDGSPGTGCPVIASITGTDYAVVVTEPTVSGVHDLKRVLDTIEFFKISCGIVINKSDLNQQKSEEIRLIAEQREADFLGEIIYNKSITLSQIKASPVVEYTDNKMTQQIKEIWNKIKNRLFE